ncbi:MAG: hypothetical protein ACRETA_05765 [Gammaproteobacteria bacterium]
MQLKHAVPSLVIALLLTAPYVYACPPILMPDTNDLNRYATVFIGEVTNLRELPQAQWQTRCITNGHHAKACRSTKISQDPVPTYEISVLSRVSIMGSPSMIVKMQLQGCGEQTPRLSSYGAFFIPKDTHQPIVPIYQSESSLYTNLLLKLGALEPKSSNWDKMNK